MPSDAGVAVKYAVKVLVAYKFRQLVPGGSLDFITAFAQLRLYELKVERFVDFLLRRGSDQFLAAIKAVRPELQTLVMGQRY